MVCHCPNLALQISENRPHDRKPQRRTMEPWKWLPCEGSVLTVLDLSHPLLSCRHELRIPLALTCQLQAIVAFGCTSWKPWGTLQPGGTLSPRETCDPLGTLWPQGTLQCWGILQPWRTLFPQPEPCSPRKPAAPRNPAARGTLQPQGTLRTPRNPVGPGEPCSPNSADKSHQSPLMTPLSTLPGPNLVTTPPMTFPWLAF